MPFPQHILDLGAKVSNWGRWGVNDRRGTLNLIDSAAVQRGAAAARTGKTFGLSIPFDEHGPQLGFIPGRVNPTRTMVEIVHSYTGDSTGFCSSDDAVTMGVQAATHWDALGHGGYDGLLYNGVSASTIDDTGSTEHGIEHFGPVVSRGLLLDVARLHGVDMLEGGYAITGDDLDAAAASADMVVMPGDIVCIRTGRIQLFRQGDRMNYLIQCAGPSTKSIEWFRDHDVAAVATDTLTFEVFPCEYDDAWLPVHAIHLRDMGLVQGQNWDYEELAADCANDGVYEFLLSATPLPLTRSTGGAVAPIAVK